MLRGPFEGLPTAKIWVRTRAMNSKMSRPSPLRWESKVSSWEPLLS